jgi:hypothetical protein
MPVEMFVVEKAKLTVARRDEALTVSAFQFEPRHLGCYGVESKIICYLFGAGVHIPVE